MKAAVKECSLAGVFYGPKRDGFNPTYIPKMFKTQIAVIPDNWAFRSEAPATLEQAADVNQRTVLPGWRVTRAIAKESKKMRNVKFYLAFLLLIFLTSPGQSPKDFNRFRSPR